jgi:hypothetical protein
LFELGNSLGTCFEVVVEQPRERAVAEHFDIGLGYRAGKTAVGVWLYLPPNGTNERLARADFEPRLSLCKIVKEHLSVESLAKFVFCHQSLVFIMRQK